MGIECSSVARHTMLGIAMAQKLNSLGINIWIISSGLSKTILTFYEIFKK